MIRISSDELRENFETISEIAHKGEDGAPAVIHITHNGNDDLVLMSLDGFELREEMVRLQAELDMIDKGRRAGRRGYTLEESMAMLERDVFSEDVKS